MAGGDEARGPAATDDAGDADPGYALGDDLDDDTPAPETGLHALGQLGVAALVVAAVLVAFLAVALVIGRVFG